MTAVPLPLSLQPRMHNDSADPGKHVGCFQAPSAVSRFKHLMEADFFDRMRFYKAQSGGVAHFGIAADPKLTKFWRKKTIYDEDREARSNRRGTVSFAGLPGEAFASKSSRP